MATTTTTTGTARQEPAVDGRGGALRAFSVPSYPALWLSGCFWNVARWLGLFTGSYLVYHQSGSTLLVQLVGAAYFAPLFVGGLASGVIADRFDRRLTVMVQLWILVALSALVGVDVIGGTTQPWHIYPAMFVLGCGSVTDLTCRRALIVDLTGTALLGNAFALESISMTGGTLFGNLFGGAIIDFAGSGQAFLGAAVLCVIAALLLLRVHMPPAPARPVATTPVLRQVAEGLRYTRGHRALLGLLAVSVVMNVFFYTYVPLVPVFAKRLAVNALWTGVLGSAAGFGSLVGAVLIVLADRPRWRVNLYAGGVGLALAALTGFALTTVYPLALLALFVAGIGLAGFSTMQATLVLYVSSEALRGRVMGVLSMAIGSLPLALFALGGVAEKTGAAPAVVGSGLLGLAMLALCWLASPAMRAIR